MTTLRALALLLLFISVPAAADSGGLEAGGTGVVREIVDGDTLIAEVTGTEAGTPPEAGKGTKVPIRLVGIQAPKLPLGRPDFEPWPLGDAAKAALSNLALGRTLRLAFGGAKLDRHGRLLAQLYAPDGTWIQGEMLKAGMARVYTFADNRALAADMYARERDARSAKRGIWAERFYAVRTPDELEKLTGTFQLVEGRIVRTAIVRSRGYLNFGEDWKTDFTVEIPPSAQSLFRRDGFDIAALSGKRVRVRGWIESFHGPMVEANHPEQIEVLEE